MPKKLTALGSYIFAGAFTEGMRHHFDIKAHFEDGTYGVKSAMLNFPRLPIFTSYDDWPAKKYKGVDLVYGNPPCAAWSAMSTKRTVKEQSWKLDPRIDCTRKHFSLLRIIKPTVWVWESVDRAFTAGREFVDMLTADALKQGYAVTHLRFDAQYIGGYHRRVRYFMIVHKVEIDWNALIKFADAPAAGEVLKKVKNKLPIDKLFVPINKNYVASWRKCKPGEPLLKGWERINGNKKNHDVHTFKTGRTRITGRPSFRYIKLNPDDVCPTIVGTNLAHPKNPRYLTMGEMKALAGYPPTWKLAIRTQRGHPDYDELTRAVMPPVGKWIGGIIRKSIEKGVKAKKKVQIVDLRKREINIEEVKHV